MLLKLLQKTGQYFYNPLRRLLDAGFGSKLNPLDFLGALTIYFFWIVVVSGIWLFIFFKTSVVGAYESVEYLTHEQWYLGGVMRSLHRYASDAAIVTLALHIIKEFILDRHRGNRWFSWLTGVPLLWLVIPLGITGYWLVWDQLAWYVALTSAELLDWMPIFSESMARNFLSDEVLSNRFFTLMAFLHLIGLPLFLVFGIWLHVLRINGPRINPPRALMAGSLAAMLALSLVYPAVSQGEVDMTTVPSTLGLDWFYLLVYPLMSAWSPGWVWGLLFAVTILLCMVPWLPVKKGDQPAVVDLDNCNGCSRCAEDCPFGAITMEPRSDGKPYETEAVVDPGTCMSCGLCTGSCPTATPFRRHSALSPGIDMPGLPASGLRQALLDAAEGLEGSGRIVVFTCLGSPYSRTLAEDEQTAKVGIICAGQLPPSFIDFVLSRDLADGVVVAGCPGGDCQYRFGAEWTALRVVRERDPHLRKRVDEKRIALAWEQPWQGHGKLADVVVAFRRTLTGEEDSPQEDKRPSNIGLKPVLVSVASYAVFMGVVAWFSVSPRFRLIEEGEAMVSLSFSHAGQRIRECRKLTQEELNRLPPNMRNPDDCPRERLPIHVSLSNNGAPLYEATISPSGIWNDGSANVYRRLTLPAGEQTFKIGMNDKGQTDTFDYYLEQEVDLEPGQHLVIEFDNTNQVFTFKQD